MNIKNFDESLDPELVCKGIDYYFDDRIVSLSLRRNVFIGDVIGNERYEVQVEINEDGDILACGCSCGKGDYCKHLIAVFAAIANYLD